MSMVISSALLKNTTSEALLAVRTRALKCEDNDRDIDVSPAILSEEVLKDLIQVAIKAGDGKTVRAAEAILVAKLGNFDKPVPNFKAFQGMLEAFLKKDLIDGWIYVSGPDGMIYPELITAIDFESVEKIRGRETARVIISTMSYSINSRHDHDALGMIKSSFSFRPEDVVKRKLSEVLANRGLMKETAALKADYEKSIALYHAARLDRFGEQFRVTGKIHSLNTADWRRRGESFEGRKVIHDLKASECGAFQNHVESQLIGEDSVGAVPEHPLIRVFDLLTHEFCWVNSDLLQPYEYDASLSDKLVLPASHRDLLDVLTTDLSAFIGDIIEGKSAGNVILCKGLPGVGKTLTAEVYSELIERPLYSIHSGSLGTTAEDIEKNLRAIFQRSKRWNCVLLLDEADVFVVRRGENIEQNAIVAEFLRTLEYFDGLLFLTTNRPNDIDEAIVSRCAAIIHYDIPGREDTASVWKVMANQFGQSLDDDLLGRLLDLFPAIAPRDIKMLFRLALRVAKKQSLPLDIEMFRRCAMFRAIEMKPVA